MHLSCSPANLSLSCTHTVSLSHSLPVNSLPLSLAFSLSFPKCVVYLEHDFTFFRHFVFTFQAICEKSAAGCICSRIFQISLHRCIWLYIVWNVCRCCHIHTQVNNVKSVVLVYFNVRKSLSAFKWNLCSFGRKQTEYKFWWQRFTHKYVHKHMLINICTDYVHTYIHTYIVYIRSAHV